MITEPDLKASEISWDGRKSSKRLNARVPGLLVRNGKHEARWNANRLAARSVTSVEDVHVGHDQDLVQRQFRAIDVPHEALRLYVYPPDRQVMHW